MGRRPELRPAVPRGAGTLPRPNRRHRLRRGGLPRMGPSRSGSSCPRAATTDERPVARGLLRSARTAAGHAEREGLRGPRRARRLGPRRRVERHGLPGSQWELCSHRRPTWCHAVHVEDDERLGTPICGDCYDYAGHVAFNWYAPELWLHHRAAPQPCSSARADRRRARRLRAAVVRQSRGVPAPRRRPLPRTDPPGWSRRLRHALASAQRGRTWRTRYERLRQRSGGASACPSWSCRRRARK